MNGYMCGPLFLYLANNNTNFLNFEPTLCINSFSYMMYFSLVVDKDLELYVIGWPPYLRMVPVT